MGTSPYENPSARLQALAYTFAFLALVMATQFSANAETLHAMLIG